MLSTYSHMSEAERPLQVDPACTSFWRLYLLVIAPLLYVALIAAATALWPADSTTTSSLPADAGSSSTGCQASTDGSSR